MSVEQNSTVIDPETLATLTPEERAAISDDNWSPEELAAMRAVAGDNELDDDDERGAGEPAASNPAAKPTEVDPSKEPTEPTVADPEATASTENAKPEARRSDEFVPRYTVELPADHAEKLEAVKAESRTLAQKYKDGEIDFDDYSAQLDQLNDRRDALNAQRVKAEIAQDITTQTEEQRWHRTVTSFIAGVAEQIDYAKDADKSADLDFFIKSLAANPANAEKSMDWFLEEAHRRVKVLHGIADKAPAPKPKEEPAPAVRKPPVEALPKTLAQVG